MGFRQSPHDFFFSGVAELDQSRRQRCVLLPGKIIRIDSLVLAQHSAFDQQVDEGIGGGVSALFSACSGRDHSGSS